MSTHVNRSSTSRLEKWRYVTCKRMAACKGEKIVAGRPPSNPTHRRAGLMFIYPVKTSIHSTRAACRERQLRSAERQRSEKLLPVLPLSIGEKNSLHTSSAKRLDSLSECISRHGLGRSGYRKSGNSTSSSSYIQVSPAISFRTDQLNNS